MENYIKRIKAVEEAKKRFEENLKRRRKEFIENINSLFYSHRDLIQASCYARNVGIDIGWISVDCPIEHYGGSYLKFELYVCKDHIKVKIIKLSQCSTTIEVYDGVDVRIDRLYYPDGNHYEAILNGVKKALTQLASRLESSLSKEERSYRLG